MRVGAVISTVISIAVTLSLGEACLRYTGSVASHFEKQGRRQEACYSESFSDPWLLVRQPNSEWFYDGKDYTQVNRIYANGLTDPEFEKKKQVDETRIIFLGDSFLQSAGDIEKGSVVNRIRNELNSKKGSRKFNLLNAGIGGSDPVFALQLFQRKLLDYSPDIVVMNGNRSDLKDFQMRGGLDRFMPDGQVKARDLPIWTPLFNRSHLFRAFALGILGYDWMCRSPSDQRKYDTDYIVQEMVKTVKAVSELARQNKIHFLFLTNPNNFALEQRAQDPTLKEIVEKLKKENVPSDDLTDEFLSRIPKAETKSYYWPTDHHYTPKGYQVFADAIISVMKKRGLIE